MGAQPFSLYLGIYSLNPLITFLYFPPGIWRVALSKHGTSFLIRPSCDRFYRRNPYGGKFRRKTNHLFCLSRVVYGFSLVSLDTFVLWAVYACMGIYIHHLNKCSCFGIVKFGCHKKCSHIQKVSFL